MDNCPWEPNTKSVQNEYDAMERSYGVERSRVKCQKAMNLL